MPHSTPKKALSKRLRGTTARRIACLAILALAAPLAAQDEPIERTDYLTFAQGALPIAIDGTAGRRQPETEQAMLMIDGNAGGFSVVYGVGREVAYQFTFALPSAVTFDRFAVPSVFETPSPGQTFFETIEIHGSAVGPGEGWQQLASGRFEVHAEKGMFTEIPIAESLPVRWIRVDLAGGLDVGRDLMTYEFSELIGNGTQEPMEIADHFDGIWTGRGVLIELQQEGAVVNGCVDRHGEAFEGTVSGSILYGRSTNPTSGVGSLFVLQVGEGGALTGIRSTNGAPFRLYEGSTAPSGTTTACSEIPPPTLGCGSVIQGIGFDFNSANLRSDSAPILTQLYDGLQADTDTGIVIVGHTSSEGSTEYNQQLSERRAQSVVDDLVRRGIDAGRIRALGKGETSPIASNDDESGRSMNRRVEVECED